MDDGIALDAEKAGKWMAAPIYDVVFHEGHWRIRYDNLHFGQYETAVSAAEAALKVVRSRINANGARIITHADGTISVGEPTSKA